MVEALAMRERLFTIRMNDEEYARLDRVARKYGLNAAGVVRMLIKREADAVDAESPAPVQAKPSKARKAKR